MLEGCGQEGRLGSSGHCRLALASRSTRICLDCDVRGDLYRLLSWRLESYLGSCYDLGPLS